MHTYRNEKKRRKEGKNNGCEGKENSSTLGTRQIVYNLMCYPMHASKASPFIVVLHVGPINLENLVMQVFVESSMPVIKHYEGKGKLRRFDATPPPSEVFEQVKKLFVQTPASVL